VYSLYYAAYASAHLRQFQEAESSALAAIQLDVAHHMPQLYLLLANVYAGKGDTASEISELRQYLKFAPKSPGAATATATLAQLDTKPAK
jgi:tetratricopeptide (TPR) repeat protein